MRGHQPPGFTAQQDDDGDPKTGQFRGKIPMISETYTLNAPVIARWIIARMKQDQKDPPNLPLLIVDDLEAELIAALDGLSFPLIVSRWAGQPPPEPEVRIVSPRAGETVTMEVGRIVGRYGDDHFSARPADTEMFSREGHSVLKVFQDSGRKDTIE